MLSPYYQIKHIQDILWNQINQSFFLQNGIPTDFPLRGLLIEFRGRLTVTDPGAGAAGVVLPEAPFNLFKRIKVNGVHQDRGAETIFDMEGSSLRRYCEYYVGYPPIFYNPDTLAGAAAAYDMVFQLYVPFALERVSPQHELLSLLDAQRYDNLQLELEMGDGLDLFTLAHTMTDTFNAFEVAGGSPTLRISRVVAHLGRDIAFRPALVKRTFKDIDGNQALVDGFITELNTGNAIRSVMIKQFVRGTGTELPNALTLPTWSTVFLTRAKIKINDVPIRDAHWSQLVGYNVNQFHTVDINPQAVPYGIFEFVENGDMNQALVTYDFKARGKRLELCGDVAAAANQRIHVIQTEIIPAGG